METESVFCSECRTATSQYVRLDERSLCGMCAAIQFRAERDAAVERAERAEADARHWGEKVTALQVIQSRHSAEWWEQRCGRLKAEEERDSALKARDEARELLATRARAERAEAELAASERERERMRSALEQIVKGAPTEEPQRGDYTGNADDDYSVGLERAHWGCAEIARAALSPAQPAAETEPKT